jgi:hypothetical protein
MVTNLSPRVKTNSTSKRERPQIPTGPGLGVGEFQVEVAAAHPFDPNAFPPMWSDAWRKRF